MKRFFTIVISLLLLIFNLQAQIAVSSNNRQYAIPNRNHTKTNPVSSLNKTSTCSVDTLEYTISKASALEVLNINSSVMGAAYQWFPAPQAITVNGFKFYAILDNTLGIASQLVTLSIYNAGIDSMPSGAALRTVTMLIDTNFGNGTLEAIRRRAIFSSPITITSPNGYVIAMENTSANSVYIVTNSLTNQDGYGEWCASVKLYGTNTRSYNVYTNPYDFDADFLMFPIVSYSLASNYSSTPTCFTPGNPVSFTNTSSAVNFSNFYNIRQAYGVIENSFTWDFGNGNKINAVDTSVTYSSSGPYTVKLTDTIEGYYRFCVDTKSLTLNSSSAAPTAGGGGNYCIGSTLSLTCSTVSGASYYWTGPNGYTSTSQNPSRTSFSSLMAGQYDVMTINGNCSSAVASVIVAAILPPVATSNSPVCFGQTLNLTSSLVPGASYSWTGPHSFTSNQQSPNRTNITALDTGLYTLSVSLSGCSFTPVTTRVAGKTTPVVPSVGVLQTLCVGSNINLTAQGTYSNPTFTWIGPNNYSSNLQNPTFLSTGVNNSGNYSVTVTVNGCTSSSASMDAVVNANPIAPTVSSNGALCAGQTLSLSASTITNATYTWTGPHSFSSSLQNPTRANITLVDSGSYSVYVTVNNCNSPTASISVSVGITTPSPTATSNSPVCSGKPLSLYASNVSGATYTWTGPNNFSSNLQNPVLNNVNPADAGLYSVIATTSNCGTSIASNVNVTVSSLSVTPVASNSGPVCVNGSSTLSITYISGATYGWTGPNNFFSSSVNPSLNNITKAMAGTYTVIISTAQCGAVGTYSTDLVVKQKPIISSVNTNSPLCAGDTLQISVNVTNTSNSATFAWSGPNNYSNSGKSIIINNISSLNEGSYIVTTTDSACSSSDFITNFIVKPKPNAPTITNSSPQCVGTKLDLSASLITNASYLWTGPNNFTSTQRTPSILAITKACEGVYKVMCIVNGCKSAEEISNVVVNVKPATPVITNNGPYCERTNIDLTVPAVSGATYSWIGPVNYASNSQNVSLTSAIPIQSGVYTCVMTVANCVSDAATTTLVVNSLPTPPNLSSFPVNKLCSGDSLQLFASFTDLATYSWTGPAGFVSALRNPVIKNTNQAYSGTYSVTLTKSTCTSLPASITVTVNPTPSTSNITGLAHVLRLDTGSYSVIGLQGSSFDWNVIGANVLLGAGSNKIQVKWLNVGAETIKVKETSDQGCLGIEKSFAVNVTSGTGINEFQSKSDIIIYPNPMNEMLSISLLGNHKLQSATIFDLVGNEIISTHKSDIDVSQLKTGIYVIKVTDNKGNTFSQKVIKN